MAVVPGVTLELTLAQYWSSVGPSAVSLEVEFKGVRPTTTAMLSGGLGYERLRLEAQVRSGIVQPSGKWEAYQRSIRPQSAEITPLTGARDRWTDGRQIYQLVLTYEFTQTKDESKSKITPRLPALNSVLYESPYESQLCILFDQNRQVLGTSDAFPSGISVPPNTSKCTARIQIRHEQVAALERLKQQLLIIERPLPKALAMTFVRSKTDAILGKGDAVKAFHLTKGVPDVIYVLEVKFDDLPKSIQEDPNHVVLLGSYSICKPNSEEHGASTKPGGFPLRYIVPAACTKFKDDEATTKSTKTKEIKTEQEKFETSVREFYESKIEALAGQDSFLDIWAQASARYPDSLPLQLSKLRHWKSTDYLQIIASADNVLACVSKLNSKSDKTTEPNSLVGLTNYFGQRVLDTDVKGLEVQKEKNTQKDAVIEALGKKTYALGALVDEQKNKDDVSLGKYKTSYEELQAWIDVSKELKTTGMIKLQYDMKQGHFGLAVQTLWKILELEDDKPKSMIYGESKKDLLQRQYPHILRQLKWNHVAQCAEQSLLVKYPAHFPLF